LSYDKILFLVLHHLSSIIYITYQYMAKLNEFMLLFRYIPEHAKATSENLGEMERQWGAFIGGIAMQGRLVSTYQLGLNTKTLTAVLQPGTNPTASDPHLLGGNMVLKAETIEEAAELAKRCPILSIGGSVEVRDVIPM
jgi:hypothetical protein